MFSKNNIDTEFLEEDYYAIYDFWEHRFALDHNLILKCWQEAKKITNSKLRGFLLASDFAGDITNLDNGDSFFGVDNTVEKYLTERGIHIQKDAAL
jgi:hypothetical protein